MKLKCLTFPTFSAKSSSLLFHLPLFLHVKLQIVHLTLHLILSLQHTVSLLPIYDLLAPASDYQTSCCINSLPLWRGGTKHCRNYLFEAPTGPHLSPPLHTHASLPQHILKCVFHSPFLRFPPPCRLCLFRFAVPLISTLSPPCFDIAASWNFQPRNPCHQKFIEPGEQTCEATRRGSGTHSPITPSLSFSRFLSSFIFASLDLPLYAARSSSLTRSRAPRISSPVLPPSSPLFFTLLSSLYHPLCHCGNFLPSWQACNCCPLSASLPLPSPSLPFSCRCLTLSTSR